MAKDATSTILTLGVIGGIGYLLYNWWTTTCIAGSAAMSSFPCSLFGSAASTATTTTTTTTPAPTTPAATTPVPTTPAYSGDSLAQMLAGLTKEVTAAYGADPALSCSASNSGESVTTAQANLTSTQAALSQSPADPTLLLQLGLDLQALATASSAAPATCQNPYATYDVFNYYLVAANVGVTTAPAPPDNTSVISLSAYWAWCAPLLQQAMPGLSGGHVYAGLGAIAMRTRGW